ncbi:hypothetical protein KR018_000345 [Drosophila ironensis]|nr:hypothetical protein KR018_000345 [Drosophila ironensis]
MFRPRRQLDRPHKRLEELSAGELQLVDEACDPHRWGFFRWLCHYSLAAIDHSSLGGVGDAAIAVFSGLRSLFSKSNPPLLENPEAPIKFHELLISLMPPYPDETFMYMLQISLLLDDLSPLRISESVCSLSESDQETSTTSVSSSEDLPAFSIKNILNELAILYGWNVPRKRRARISSSKVNSFRGSQRAAEARKRHTLSYKNAAGKCRLRPCRSAFNILSIYSDSKKREAS